MSPEGQKTRTGIADIANRLLALAQERQASAITRSGIVPARTVPSVLFVRSQSRRVNIQHRTTVATLATSSVTIPSAYVDTPHTSTGKQSESQIVPSRQPQKKKCTLTKIGKQQLKCNTCGHVSARKGHHLKHYCKRTGEKPYQCNFVLGSGTTKCGKFFAHLTSLNIHMYAHTGEKPHQCRYCEKAFTRKHSRNAHELIHTNEKPHQCQYCGKAFTRSHNRKTHELIHTNEKPFHCNVCDYRSHRKADIQKHMCTHARKKPFRCPLCKYGGNRKTHLQRHMNSMHPAPPETDGPSRPPGKNQRPNNNNRQVSIWLK